MTTPRPNVSWTSWISLIAALVSLLASAAFSYSAYTTKLDNTIAIVQQQGTDQKELSRELINLRIRVAELAEAVRANTELQRKK